MRNLLFGAFLAFVVTACATTTGSPALGSVSPVQSEAAGSPSAGASPQAGLVLVAIGDAIPFNSPDVCRGCKGFVQRYADALAEASGKSVKLMNVSEDNFKTVDMLLREVTENTERRDQLASADAIIVGIAQNDVPMSRHDDACDGAGGENIDWSRFTDHCIAAEVKRFTPMYERVYATVAKLRAGKATILRTINLYNGWTYHLSAANIAAVKVIKTWNKMICGAAEANGFVCADISTKFNGPDGTRPSGDLLAADYSHPSDKGNAAIADVLIQLGFAPLVH